MPSVRTKLECAKPLLKNVKGLLFSRAYRAFTVDVPTVIHPTRDCLAVPRFPCFETILGAGLEIYETWVTYEDGLGSLYRFLIAAHYDPAREINTALRTIVPNTTWRGDLIVMRGGTAVFVVNMGDSEYRVMAARAVRTFLLEAIPLVAAALQNHEPINIPTYM
ncbi:hypothetical protein C8Q73DRAFT_791218 [Cubamyces lactineus]|nr:hypothetical protein C8Q73DRAFT_791218 [Cubamyces lactineus]